MTEYKTELCIKNYVNISNIINLCKKYNLSNLTNLSIDKIHYPHDESSIHCLFDFLRKSNITYFEILDTKSANEFINIVLENKFNIMQPGSYKFFNNLKTLKLGIDDFHVRGKSNVNNSNIIKFLQLCPNIKTVYLKTIDNLIINNIKVSNLYNNYWIYNAFVRLQINNHIRKLKLYRYDYIHKIYDNLITFFPNLFSITLLRDIRDTDYKYTKKIHLPNNYHIKYFLPGKHDKMSLKNICLDFIYNDTSINIKNKKFHFHKDLYAYGKYNNLNKPMISHKNYYKHDFLNQSIASNMFSNLPHHIKEQLLIGSNYVIEDFTKTITVYY